MSRQELLDELGKLSEPELAEMLSRILKERRTNRHESGVRKIPAQAAYGLLKGTFTMSDDFDAPLDDFAQVGG